MAPRDRERFGEGAAARRTIDMSRDADKVGNAPGLLRQAKKNGLLGHQGWTLLTPRGMLPPCVQARFEPPKASVASPRVGRPAYGLAEKPSIRILG